MDRVLVVQVLILVMVRQAQPNLIHVSASKI